MPGHDPAVSALPNGQSQKQDVFLVLTVAGSQNWEGEGGKGLGCVFLILETLRNTAAHTAIGKTVFFLFSIFVLENYDERPKLVEKYLQY